MKRRRFLRVAGGLSVAVGSAGCLGLFDDDDSSPEPVTAPSTGDGDDVPPEVEESAEHLSDAQRELSAAVASIEHDLNEFDGLLDREANPVEPGSVDGRLESARESLQAAEDGATDGQLIMVEELGTLIHGIEEFDQMLVHLETVIDAFMDWEAAVRDHDIGRARNAIQTFDEAAHATYEQLETTEGVFSDVSGAVLNEAEDISPGRVDRAFIDAQDAVDFIFVIYRGAAEYVEAVPELESALQAIERGDLDTAMNQLDATVTQFEAANEQLQYVDESVEFRYRPDVQALQCVTQQTKTASEEFHSAIEAYLDGRATDAVQHAMRADDQIGNCGYELVNDMYDDLVDELLAAV